MTDQITIFNTVSGVRIPRSKLIKLGEIILAGEKSAKDINLVLVSDQRMARLNREYRGQQGTTDVLSFPLADDTDSLLGEIYISIPKVRTGASIYKTSFTGEILRLFCHGVLHLLGFDHHNDKERKIMVKKEDYYMSMYQKLEVR